MTSSAPAARSTATTTIRPARRRIIDPDRDPFGGGGRVGGQPAFQLDHPVQQDAERGERRGGHGEQQGDAHPGVDRRALRGEHGRLLVQRPPPDDGEVHHRDEQEAGHPDDRGRSRHPVVASVGGPGPLTDRAAQGQVAGVREQ
ncbi:hypothetical protein [Micromonospora sp. 4G55]|uniref:hypothetical protein n=1 Tax=Micromonospora sp. 4G55 TaxID=2806102 RepID=UPI001EE40F58|nr:hypothetical protein [Micromonospora sp. 4G55]